MLLRFAAAYSSFSLSIYVSLFIWPSLLSLFFSSLRVETYTAEAISRQWIRRKQRIYLILRLLQNLRHPCSCSRGWTVQQSQELTLKAENFLLLAGHFKSTRCPWSSIVSFYEPNRHVRECHHSTVPLFVLHHWHRDMSCFITYLCRNHYFLALRTGKNSPVLRTSRLSVLRRQMVLLSAWSHTRVTNSSEEERVNSNFISTGIEKLLSTGPPGHQPGKQGSSLGWAVVSRRFLIADIKTLKWGKERSRKKEERKRMCKGSKQRPLSVWLLRDGYTYFDSVESLACSLLPTIQVTQENDRGPYNSW